MWKERTIIMDCIEPRYALNYIAYILYTMHICQNTFNLRKRRKKKLQQNTECHNSRKYLALKSNFSVRDLDRHHFKYNIPRRMRAHAIIVCGAYICAKKRCRYRHRLLSKWNYLHVCTKMARDLCIYICSPLKWVAATTTILI